MEVLQLLGAGPLDDVDAADAVGDYEQQAMPFRSADMTAKAPAPEPRFRLGANLQQQPRTVNYEGGASQQPQQQRSVKYGEGGGGAASVLSQQVRQPDFEWEKSPSLQRRVSSSRAIYDHPLLLTRLCAAAQRQVRWRQRWRDWGDARLLMALWAHSLAA